MTCIIICVVGRIRENNYSNCAMFLCKLDLTKRMYKVTLLKHILAILHKNTPFLLSVQSDIATQKAKCLVHKKTLTSDTIRKTIVHMWYERYGKEAVYGCFLIHVFAQFSVILHLYKDLTSEWHLFN